MNEYVKWIQQSLKALGYDTGPVDGLEGPKTEAAIRKFQSDQELEVDGLVGKYTHIALMTAMNVKMIPTNPEEKLHLDNFYDDEFACICGCGLDVCDRLKIFAQNLRNFFGWPLTISSGGRCPPVNRDAGGVIDSCHLTGEAFDAYFNGHMNESVMAQMADFAVSQNIGVIRYPNMLFCHFQISPRNDFIY